MWIHIYCPSPQSVDVYLRLNDGNKNPINIEQPYFSHFVASRTHHVVRLLPYMVVVNCTKSVYTHDVPLTSVRVSSIRLNTSITIYCTVARFISKEGVPNAIFSCWMYDRLLRFYLSTISLNWYKTQLP